MTPSFPLPSMRALVRRAGSALAFVAVAVSVASCALSRPAPVKHAFLLDPAMPAAVAVANPATLRVGVVSVAAPFRGRALVYRQDEVKYEADYYDEFFVAPVAMLSGITTRAVTAAGVFRRVIPSGAVPDDADYVLDGFASELYGDLRDPAKPAAVVAVTFYVSSATALMPAVVWSQAYQQRVPASDSTAEAMARAWNAGLTAIYADLARDLAAAQLPAK